MNNELALQFCKTIVNSVKSSWTHETLMLKDVRDSVVTHPCLPTLNFAFSRLC